MHTGTHRWTGDRTTAQQLKKQARVNKRAVKTAMRFLPAACLSFLVSIAFWLPAWLAVWLPAHERVFSWKKPSDGRGCSVLSSGGGYECACSTDEYGVESCSYCEDFLVSYAGPRGGAGDIQVELRGRSIGEFDVGKRYPDCLYDPTDLTRWAHTLVCIVNSLPSTNCSGYRLSVLLSSPLLSSPPLLLWSPLVSGCSLRKYLQLSYPSSS